MEFSSSGLSQSGTADAAPILYLYTGTASADPDLQAFIPPGSHATIGLIVDPAVNLVAGVPGYPPDVGGYYFTAVLDFTGRQYTLGGVFEVNMDLAVLFPHPGSIDLVELVVHGPPLVEDHPPFYGPATACGFTSVCRVDSFGTSDPTSPALPFFPFVSFPMSFEVPVEDPNQFPFERVTISGSYAQVVPEPSTLLLVGTGLVAVARRRLTGSKHSNELALCVPPPR